jgi:hypothetical protein
MPAISLRGPASTVPSNELGRSAISKSEGWVVG